VKAAIVESDPRELGLRAILNFGHTVGHALEAASHYERFTHGEAVAVGMARALDLGDSLGITPRDVGARVRNVLETLGLDCTVPADLLRHAMTYLHGDKKREGQRLRFVLLENVGRARTEYVTPAQVSDLLTG
jgi:3-dehydroquinate synthase